MSNALYRLETARTKHIPGPLHLETSSFYSKTSQQDPQPLLYDLPSASLTPPTSPRSMLGQGSPTFPSYVGRSRLPKDGKLSPSPGRHRSLTPIGVGPNELEKFAENCRGWYFNQDENAGRLMTQTLATLPAAHRVPFSRVQASIRAAYHRSVNTRKTAEFRAHLAATQPGGSLLPHHRVDPKGPAARKERYERVDHFLRTWCTVGMPGTKPFFQSLWAILRLQVVPNKLGGAGKFRIEWEFDDAVFKEAAGKDFMLEAVDILKGVLAFEEVPSTRTVSITSDFQSSPLNVIHSRSQSQPLSSYQKPVSHTPLANRARAPSDPFLDTPKPAISTSFSPDTKLQATTDNHADVAASLLGADNPIKSLNIPSLDEEEEEEEYLRIWTSPDLPNSEILELLKLFPPFISRSTFPRFPAPSPSRIPDLEEGDDSVESRQIRFGTGAFWISTKERSEGWQGGWWSRFILWFRSTFC
ncbi:hypothetical protein M378DRAFT_76236 [Amanita muscaria Koide BX008]|uniref:Uncharacterized protein n=1 Tax=Amanita muscaria (strain Koide BX008) TaxID=946122 RepID=A0A0C2X9D1_AMAMK|nr:hypothetical protein M378DRAFT_76236 [Amanita muscaria Koide BX008]